MNSEKRYMLPVLRSMAFLVQHTDTFMELLMGRESVSYLPLSSLMPSLEQSGYIVHIMDERNQSFLGQWIALIRALKTRCPGTVGVYQVPTWGRAFLAVRKGTLRHGVWKCN